MFAKYDGDEILIAGDMFAQNMYQVVTITSSRLQRTTGGTGQRKTGVVQARMRPIDELRLASEYERKRKPKSLLARIQYGSEGRFIGSPVVDSPSKKI